MSMLQCKCCNAKITAYNAAFCPVCGVELPADFGEQAEMIYKSIKVSEYGKALVCPHCENEEPSQGDYCKICGSDIVNHCCDLYDLKNGKLIRKGCKNILHGDARYCSKCGNEGNFFQKGWLNDWKGENIKKAIRNIRSSDNTMPFSGIMEEKAE